MAELAGTSTTASVNIDNGSLAVNQSTNTSFSGALVGNGALTKTGSGSLNLTGTNTYTGGTAVNEGRLAVNGSIVSPWLAYDVAAAIHEAKAPGSLIPSWRIWPDLSSR